MNFTSEYFYYYFILLFILLFSPLQVEHRNLKLKQLINSDDDERKMIADTMVTALINTLIRELHNDSVLGRKQEAEKVRFFIVICLYD